MLSPPTHLFIGLASAGGAKRLLLKCDVSAAACSSPWDLWEFSAADNVSRNQCTVHGDFDAVDRIKLRYLS